MLWAYATSYPKISSVPSWQHTVGFDDLRDLSGSVAISGHKACLINPNDYVS